MFERKFSGLASSHSPPEAKAPAPVPESDSAPEPRSIFDIAKSEHTREDQVTFRLKSVAGIGFLLLAFYASATMIGGKNPRNRDLRAPTPGAISRPPEDRSADRARSRAGFFQRYFCKGLQRSYFCSSGAE